jgi:hypothetical protein
VEIFKKYVQNPVPVHAVRITVDNMAEIAEELGVPVLHDDHSDRPYFKVHVRYRGLCLSQHVDAYIGDWVVINTGNKQVYREGEFQGLFTQA